MGSSSVARALGAALTLASLGCAGGLATAPSPAETGDTEPTHYVATFRLQEAAGSADDTPRTAIAWVMHSETAPSVTRELGIEHGACTLDADAADALARVACWWGGERGVWRARRVPGGVRLERAEAPGAPWDDRGLVALDDDATIELLR